MAFLENGLGLYYVDIYYQLFNMLNTVFKPSNESSNVKQLVAHMLQSMNFEKYQKFLQRADKYPQKDHKFVLFEYIESPSDGLISRSERLSGTRMTIHNVIQNPDFDENMMRLFGNSDRRSWYTRRKIDYTTSVEGDLSDSRQVVILIKREPEEDYSDMPGLISAADVYRPVLNPEEHSMPELIPLSPYNTISGVNQTMWSPYSYNYTYLSPATHALS